jgi:hypothetical protein
LWCFADHDRSAGVAEALRAHASQVIPHPSGRPWLIGRWPADRLVIAEAGALMVAAIGCCPVTATGLSAAAGRVRTVGDVDGLAARLSGSFHLITSVGGRVRGSISGLRQVFSTRVAGVTVASDRADVLAGLRGAKVDETHWWSACWTHRPLTRCLICAAGRGYMRFPAAAPCSSTLMGQTGWWPGGGRPSPSCRWSRRRPSYATRWLTRSPPALAGVG